MKTSLFIFNSNMKKFIKKLFLIVLTVLLLLTTVNYFGDAARLFDSNYEIKMASIIRQGYNVTNISNFNERLFQKEIIKNLKVNPDILVLGSSRSMLINSDYFEEEQFFNSSVSGASIEDIIGIYQLYIDNDKLPEKIILCIDPWIFNENNGQKRWQSLQLEYYKFKGEERIIENSLNIDKYFQIFSLSYFQGSLKNLFKVIFGENYPVATKNKENENATILIDGSYVYSKIKRECSEKLTERISKQYVNDEIYSIEQFENISEKIRNSFSLLIKDIKSKDIEIAFFLPPYYPSVYNVIREDYTMVDMVEVYIIEYAKTNNIKVYGSFNPININLNESYFYDGMHCKESGIKKILNSKM